MKGIWQDAHLAPHPCAFETASARLVPACQGKDRGGNGFEEGSHTSGFIGFLPLEKLHQTFQSSESDWLPSQVYPCNCNNNPSIRCFCCHRGMQPFCRYLSFLNYCSQNTCHELERLIAIQPLQLQTSCLEVQLYTVAHPFALALFSPFSARPNWCENHSHPFVCRLGVSETNPCPVLCLWTPCDLELSKIDVLLAWEAAAGAGQAGSS